MKYSIITINYNNKVGLQKTIDSVINQSYKDFEYIIIDGGSTDGSIDIIRQYADKIDYWISEPDKGIYHAMNKGIKQAHGKYLNFMNSGDCFYDFNVLYNVSLYLTTDIIEGYTYNTNTTKSSFRNENFTPTMQFFYSGSLNHQACFIKKHLFTNLPYDENYHIISDWIFFIETIIFQNKVYKYIPICIAKFEGYGISASERTLIERNDFLKKRFPEKILADYEKYKDKDSPILDLIPLFNKTYRLHKFIYKVIKGILYIHKKIS